MDFKLEKEMIPIIKNGLNKYFKFNALAEELPVNHRIVDIVIADITFENEHIYKNKQNLTRLSLSELDVLAMIYIEKNVSIHFLKSRLHMDPTNIKKLYISKFERLGLIRKSSRYKYETTAWANIKVNSIVSIEAKLSNWKEALQQGIDNLSFADYSYVALDESSINTQKISEHFKKYNIGLLSVNNNGMVKLVYKSKRNKSPNYSDFAFQRMILCRDIIINKRKWSMT